MKQLELELHPQFERVLGYVGHAAVVVFYWDDRSDQLMYDDGLEVATANTWAYLIWAGHGTVKPQLGWGTSIWMLERRERKLYQLSRSEAISLFTAMETPQLLAEESKEVKPWEEAQRLLSEFVVWLNNQKSVLAV